MAWFWFACFACAVIFIGVLFSGGAVDTEKAKKVLGEDAQKVEDATAALTAKAKETIQKERNKP